MLSSYSSTGFKKYLLYFLCQQFVNNSRSKKLATSWKCTECKGFHDEPQCASVCPVDCCVPDEDHVETEETLLGKKAWLHGE